MNRFRRKKKAHFQEFVHFVHVHDRFWNETPHKTEI